MNIEVYSHNNAKNIIEEQIQDQIFNVIKFSNFEIIKGCGNKLRDSIKEKLKAEGWSNKFNLDAHSKITLTSGRDDLVLCFQTGNMGRFYADLLKLEYVFKNNKAKAAIYLIPSKNAAKKIGSNIAHFDRFKFELTLFKQIITTPILIIGIT